MGFFPSCTLTLIYTNLHADQSLLTLKLSASESPFAYTRWDSTTVSLFYQQVLILACLLLI